MASTSNGTSDGGTRKLIEIFDEGFKLYNTFDKCNEPSNNQLFQNNVKKCMHLLEDATRLVSATDMFSKNEEVDEIATSDLRYLLLPALLGNLALRLCDGDRPEIVRVAEVYFQDFIKRCSEYGLIEENRERTVMPSVPRENDEAAQIAAMVSTRNAKLQRYNAEKDLEKQVQALQVAMDSEHSDEDIKRQFFLGTIKMFILKAHEELATLELEKQILEHMKTIQASSDDPDSVQHKHKRRVPPSQPLKPVIIARDALQKAVMGLGYPSIPTYTVQEFYDQRIQDGVFPDPNKPRDPNAPKALQDMSEAEKQAVEDKQDEEDEQKIEDDDEETIQRARAMDEYKDDHRRGWGNRYNRS